MTNDGTKAPAHLTRATKRWFKDIAASYELQSHHLRLLEMAAQSWDEYETARAAVAEHGLTYVDRYGQSKERPEVGTARQARISFARLLRELALDVEPPPETRPPRLGGHRQ